MFTLNPKMFPCIVSLSCFLAVAEGEKILISRTRLAPDYSLKDTDGDNIPGEAGVDYPIYNSVPSDTSFRCRDHDYAGYFGDVETGCQAYHVCFPDGRNASFLCVNGTVFHQRHYVCDWWFHFDCNNSPELYELNLFRKIPLPVLPPVQRKPFVKPIPEPGVASPRSIPPSGFVGPRSSPPPGAAGPRSSPPPGAAGPRSSPPPGAAGPHSRPPSGVLGPRGNPPPGSVSPRTNLLVPRQGGGLTNPNRNSNRIPGDGDAPGLSPGRQGKYPDQEKKIPNRIVDDCECFCDDGKTQRTKYSTYKNQ